MKNTELLKYTINTSNLAKGVILNLDFTNSIYSSTAGSTTIFMNWLIAGINGGEKLKIYSCEDKADSTVQDCSTEAHYSKDVATVTKGDANVVTVLTISITKKDATYASVSVDGGSVKKF